MLTQGLSEGDFQSLGTHIHIHTKAQHLPFVNDRGGKSILLSKFIFLSVQIALQPSKPLGAVSARDKE